MKNTEYDADQMVSDIANSKMAIKAKLATLKFNPGSLWTFIKSLLLGIGKAVLFAPLSITLFPIINAWKRSR